MASTEIAVTERQRAALREMTQAAEADGLHEHGTGFINTRPRRIQMSRQWPWRQANPDAVIVDRRTKWGNPFYVGGPSGLAREPAVSNPGHSWEYEGRITGLGRHDYYHADGHVTACTIRAMTLDEVVQCFRAMVNGGGWPLDWMGWSRYPKIEEIRDELGGKDLACWCPLDQKCHADVLLELAAP